MTNRNVIHIIGLLSERLEQQQQQFSASASASSSSGERITILGDFHKLICMIPPGLLFSKESFPVWGYSTHLLLNISSSLSSYKERMLALNCLQMICSNSPIDFCDSIVPGLSSQLLKVLTSFAKDSTEIVTSTVKLLFMALKKSWKAVVDSGKVSLIISKKILPIIKEVNILSEDVPSDHTAKILDEFHSSLLSIPLQFDHTYLECLSLSSRGKSVEGITVLYEDILRRDPMDWNLVSSVVSSTVWDEFEGNTDLLIESLITASSNRCFSATTSKTRRTTRNMAKAKRSILTKMPMLQRCLIRKLVVDGIEMERIIEILDCITICWNVTVSDEFSLSFLLDSWISLYQNSLLEFSPLEELFILSLYRSLNALLLIKSPISPSSKDEWEYILPIFMQGLSYSTNSEIREESLVFLRRISSSSESSCSEFIKDRFHNLLQKISSDLRFPAIFPRAPLALQGFLVLVVGDIDSVHISTLSSLSTELIENSSNYTDRPAYLIGLLGVLISIVNIIGLSGCGSFDGDGDGDDANSNIINNTGTDSNNNTNTFMEGVITFALNFTSSDYEIIRIRSLELIYEASMKFPVSSPNFLPIAARCWKPLLSRIGISSSSSTMLAVEKETTATPPTTTTTTMIGEPSLKVRVAALKVMREHCRIANTFLRDRFLKQFIDRLPIVLSLLSYDSLGVLMDCLSFVGGNFLQFRSIYFLFKSILKSSSVSAGVNVDDSGGAVVVVEKFKENIKKLEKIEPDAMFFIVHLFKGENVINGMYKGMVDELSLQRKELHPFVISILDDK